MDTVLCPTCKKEVKWELKNPFCPFCCERCKILDLGAWASSVYGIPDKPVDFEEIEKLLDDSEEGFDEHE